MAINLRETEPTVLLLDSLTASREVGLPWPDAWTRATALAVQQLSRSRRPAVLAELNRHRSQWRLAYQARSWDGCRPPWLD